MPSLDSAGGGGGGVVTAIEDANENDLVTIHATTTALQSEENLTFASKKLSLFNETDEIGSAGWVSNVFTIGTEASGGEYCNPTLLKVAPSTLDIPQQQLSGRVDTGSPTA